MHFTWRWRAYQTLTGRVVRSRELTSVGGCTCRRSGLRAEACASRSGRGAGVVPKFWIGRPHALHERTVESRGYQPRTTHHSVVLIVMLVDIYFCVLALCALPCVIRVGSDFLPNRKACELPAGNCYFQREILDEYHRAVITCLAHGAEYVLSSAERRTCSKPW